MPKKSVAEHSLEWFHLVNSVEADIPDAFLRELLVELRHVRETILQLETERLALTARRQQITRDLEALKNRGAPWPPASAPASGRSTGSTARS